jgi:hypothetical protein
VSTHKFKVKSYTVTTDPVEVTVNNLEMLIQNDSGGATVYIINQDTEGDVTDEVYPIAVGDKLGFDSPTNGKLVFYCATTTTIWILQKVRGTSH